MMKSKFFLFLLPFLLVLSSCDLVKGSKSNPEDCKGFAPKSLTDHKIEFYTYKVEASFNDDFFRKTAVYLFTDDSNYRLYLDNKLHSSGYYAYRKVSDNEGQALISYPGKLHTVKYLVFFKFSSPTEGTLEASNHEAGGTNAFEAKFKVISTQTSSKHD